MPDNSAGNRSTHVGVRAVLITEPRYRDDCATPESVRRGCYDRDDVVGVARERRDRSRSERCHRYGRLGCRQRKAEVVVIGWVRTRSAERHRVVANLGDPVPSVVEPAVRDTGRGYDSDIDFAVPCQPAVIASIILESVQRLDRAGDARVPSHDRRRERDQIARDEVRVPRDLPCRLRKKFRRDLRQDTEEGGDLYG